MPYVSPSLLLERYTPLADYLAKQLAMPVSIHITKNYEDQVENLNNNTIDIAFLGAAPYVKLVEKEGQKRILARYEMNSKATFQGVIFVHKDSPVKNLEELTGKRMAFGNKHSTLSHLIPRVMLLENDIQVADLAHYGFLGSHDNVIMNVLFGQYDAGGVADEVFALHADKPLRILAYSDPISTHVFVASDTLPQSLVKKISALLHGLKYTTEGKKVIKSIGIPVTGFVPAVDSDYEQVRQVFKQLRAIGVNP